MRNLTQRFIRDARGGITPFGLFMLMAIFAVGGLAIDVTNAIRERTFLQVAADAAAHAALVTRDTETADDARLVALQIAEGIMPAARFGNTISAEDIHFGRFNPEDNSFEIDENSKKAVWVNTQRVASRGNSVGTFFLRLVGVNEWNVARAAVFETYKPACLREGYVASGVVDISSGNHFMSGFCIHSNTYVSMSTDNTFDDGTIVSMPDEDDLAIPSSGLLSNTGLTDALREASYTLKILNRIEDIMEGVTDPESPYFRSFLDLNKYPEPISITANKKLDAQWFEGAVHVAECTNQNQLLETGASATLRSGVLFTNCKVFFPNEGALEDVSIVSTNTLDNSVGASASFRMGEDDDCEPGGGAQIITLGGVHFASTVSFYNAQIIAGKDIEFQANIDGQMGVSLIAEGTISGTSNGEVGFCNGEGMENNFEAWFFRMSA